MEWCHVKGNYFRGEEPVDFAGQSQPSGTKVSLPCQGWARTSNCLRPPDPRNHEKAAGSSGKLVELKLLKRCTDPPLPGTGRKEILQPRRERSMLERKQIAHLSVPNAQHSIWHMTGIHSMLRKWNELLQINSVASPCMAFVVCHFTSLILFLCT